MLNLETAQSPHKLHRVAIEPVTRVEGHGKVTILLDDENRVHQVRLHIVEFRGFEIFIRGRPYWEVPIAVQRLCGICPVSHLIAATKAMDLIAGFGPLTPTAEKLRRLLHYGQIVQSHALHFFHLASPDLLLGFESEVAKRNIIGVAEAFPDLAKRGVLTRKFGQEVIRHIAGKRIHGTGVIPGGMNKALSVADRDSMRSAIDEIVDWSREAVGLVINLHETNPSFYKSFGESRANMMGLVDKRGALDFYHGALRARDADGGPIFDQVDYATYKSVLQEDIKNWSYMKFPHIRTLGADKGWYRVGPLARVQVCDVMPTPLAEAERRTFLSVDGGKPLHGALMYHWARMIEMLHAAEMARELLDDPDIVGTELMADKGPRPGRGGRRDRSAAGDALPPLSRRRRRSRDLLQSDRLDHQQQSGDERGDPRRRRALPVGARAHRGPPESYRGRHPRLRPVPLMRHPRARPNAVGGRPCRRRRRAGVAPP